MRDGMRPRSGAAGSSLSDACRAAQPPSSACTLDQCQSFKRATRFGETSVEPRWTLRRAISSSADKDRWPHYSLLLS